MSFSEARTPSKSVQHCAWHLHHSRNSVTIPVREARDEPFEYSRNCPQDRFQPTVKFRVQNTKPATTNSAASCSWWYNHVPGILTLFMDCHHENEKAISFSRWNSKFGESLRQDQPRTGCQSSSSTNVTHTHDGFSAAWKCVLCCFLDEHSPHKSYSTYTAAAPQM